MRLEAGRALTWLTNKVNRGGLSTEKQRLEVTTLELDRNFRFSVGDVSDCLALPWTKCSLSLSLIKEHLPLDCKRGGRFEGRE